MEAVSRTAHFHGVITGLVRDDTLGGRPQLVVPTVLVREMVLGDGDAGEYLPRAVIAQSTDFGLWNNKPATFDHPVKRGRFGLVGDLTPRELEVIEAGRLFNVRETAGKLKGEVWVDVDLANQTDRGRRLVEALEAHRDGDDAAPVIEVSTGYLASVVSQSGNFNGRRYHKVQQEIIPDHLAILLDSTGRCSVEDGCGLPRLNQDGDVAAEDNGQVDQEESVSEDTDGVVRKVLSRIGAALSGGIGISEGEPDCRCHEARGNAGANETREALNDAVRAELGGEGVWVYVEDFDEAAGTVIYSVQEEGKEDRLFLAPYTLDEEEVSATVDFAAAQEVAKKVEYVPVDNEEDRMQETINALVETEGFPMTAEQLNELDDAKVQGLAKLWGVSDNDEGEKSPEEPEDGEEQQASANTRPPGKAGTGDSRPRAEPKPRVNAEGDDDSGDTDIDRVVNALGLESPEEARRIFEKGREALANEESERQELVQELAANDDCAFDASDLEDWTLPKLQKLNSTIRKPVYGALGGPRRTSNQGSETRACTPSIVGRKPAASN